MRRAAVVGAHAYKALKARKSLSLAGKVYWAVLASATALELLHHSSFAVDVDLTFPPIEDDGDLPGERDDWVD